MTALPPLRIPRCLLDPTLPLPAADAEGLVAVQLEQHEGRITAIQPAEAAAMARRLPLALTPPVDPHVHLDKAFTATAFPNRDGTMAGALEANLRELAVREPGPVQERAERALELAWRHGLRALRSHVDSLSPSAEAVLEVMQGLRRRWAGRVDLQLVALAPLEHWQTAAGEAMARRMAQENGLLGSVVGPAFKALAWDARGLENLVALAERVGCALDLHIDESDACGAPGMVALARLLRRRGCGVPLTCSHASTLGLLPPAPLERLADRLAAAGVTVVALPTTNLWLLSKRPGHTPLQRPQAPLQQLQAAGVAVVVGSDNVQDPWYPGGCFDPVELIRLVTLLAHQLPWRRRGLTPYTSDAARLLGLSWDGVLRPGCPADLLVLGASSWGELLSSAPQRRVLRSGVWLPPPEQERASPLLAGLTGREATAETAADWAFAP